MTYSPRMKDLLKKSVVPILFIIVTLLAFAFRTYHYNTSVYQLNAIIADVPENERQPPPEFFKRFLPYAHNNFSPFTIESAMMFGYAKDIAAGRGVPAHDERLSGIEDIPPYSQMNMALEWFLGYAYRIVCVFSPPPEPAAYEARYQDDPRMPRFMSALLRLWASLASALIFLWLINAHVPKMAALAGGVLHAVSTGAIARATGQDIVRGEFCIPLILICFVTVASIITRPKIWKYAVLFFTAALAFAAWDLCRMIFSAWCAIELLRFALGMRVTKARAYAWGAIAAAVAINAAFVPFNIMYSLWRAELVWVLFPALGACFAYSLFMSSRGRMKVSPIRRIAIALILPAMLWGLWSVTLNTPEYASNYSHFSEAVKAKVEFDNVKPLDPAKLSYDARIMWTPSMHSATWETAATFFPSTLTGYNIGFAPLRFVLGYMPLMLSFFAALLVSSLLFSAVRREFAIRFDTLLLPCVFTIGFLVGFIYIVRYHEFLIIFLALSVPLLLNVHFAAFRRGGKAFDPTEAWTTFYSMRRLKCALRTALCVIFALILAWEAFTSLARTRRYTGDVAMADTARLIEWFRSAGERVAGKGVAANITTGPMLFAYAGTGVVMNPQFGLKRIRDATEEYLNIMYHSNDERDLADYCRRHNVSYIVFVRANPDSNPFAISAFDLEAMNGSERVRRIHKAAKEAAWVNSNRYIANASNVKDGVPARTMYYRPETMRYFVPIQPPEHLRELAKTYTIFKFVPPEAKKAALDELLKARLDDSAAKEHLAKALSLDPRSAEACEFYYGLYGKKYIPEL